MSRGKYLNVLGVRGIPAAHGGFESFVAKFALFMRDSGWRVTVYCQESGGAVRPKSWEDDWQGINRVHFETRMRDALSTIEFDLRCILHVLKKPGIDLVLGYNTALLNILQRLFGRRVIMNMDGIEWKRQKWGGLAKLWFWFNEWVGAHICSIPIADHPEIALHLAKRGCRRSVIIPYGSELITAASTEALLPLGLEPNNYFVSIARIEPENSILEIIEGFVRAKTEKTLVVLGRLEPQKNTYHQKVLAAANGKVLFPGAIFDYKIIKTLRFYCIAYMHGHQVGGTNPSLVEALGAGSPIIAHDNKFNRWTAGEGQRFFNSIDECAEAIRLLSSDIEARKAQSLASRNTHRLRFELKHIHTEYSNLLSNEITFAEALRETNASAIS